MANGQLKLSPVDFGLATLRKGIAGKSARGLDTENDCIFATKTSSTMETINVRININTPTGRRLLREIEKHPKTAIVEYHLPESKPEEKSYTVEESYEECCKILSDHYKVDVRKL